MSSPEALSDPAPRAWVLNLDAEEELSVGRRYQPSNRLIEVVRRQAPRLLGELVREEDVVVTREALIRDDSLRARTAGRVGFAWSPTPLARGLLEAAGCTPTAAPDVEVLREVNGRPFASRLRASLDHESFDKNVVCTLEEVLTLLSRPTAPLGWLVRRTFGAAGRGRRRMACGSPSGAEVAWIEAGLRKGPLVIEPWVEVTREFTRSGWVEADGTVHATPPCIQVTDRAGAWTSSQATGRRVLEAAHDRSVEQAFHAAGAALHHAGYFGPFGIDAYCHQTGSGLEVLNPMSEINARFTMDWTTGSSS